MSPLKKKIQLFSDSASKAEILLDQFSSVFTKSTSTVLPPITNRIHHSIQQLTINEDGVNKLLKNINVTKDCGPDNIPNKIFGECSSEFAPALSCIFQNSIYSGTLLKNWFNANVSPVFKKGDRHLVENYRPV